MTCPICIEMCAKTERQLATRIGSMAMVPGASVMPCPTCHGTDWATSREMIKPEPPPKPWWVIGKSTPQSWRTLGYLQLFVAGLAAGLFLLTSNWYQQMADAVLFGFLMAGALNSYSMSRFQEAMNKVRERLDEILEAEHMHVMITRDHDDVPPIAPRLH